MMNENTASLFEQLLQDSQIIDEELNLGAPSVSYEEKNVSLPKRKSESSQQSVAKRGKIFPVSKSNETTMHKRMKGKPEQKARDSIGTALRSLGNRPKLAIPTNARLTSAYLRIYSNGLEFEQPELSSISEELLQDHPYIIGFPRSDHTAINLIFFQALPSSADGCPVRKQITKFMNEALDHEEHPSKVYLNQRQELYDLMSFFSMFRKKHKQFEFRNEAASFLTREDQYTFQMVKQYLEKPTNRRFY